MTVMLPPDLGQVAFGLQGVVLWEPIRLPLIKRCVKLAVEPDWAMCTSGGIEVAHFDGRHDDAPAPCQLPLPTREMFCSVRFNTIGNWMD